MEQQKTALFVVFLLRCLLCFFNNLCFVTNKNAIVCCLDVLVYVLFLSPTKMPLFLCKGVICYLAPAIMANKNTYCTRGFLQYLNYLEIKYLLLSYCLFKNHELFF